MLWDKDTLIKLKQYAEMMTDGSAMTFLYDKIKQELSNIEDRQTVPNARKEQMRTEAIATLELLKPCDYTDNIVKTLDIMAGYVLELTNEFTSDNVWCGHVDSNEKEYLIIELNKAYHNKFILKFPLEDITTEQKEMYEGRGHVVKYDMMDEKLFFLNKDGKTWT